MNILLLLAFWSLFSWWSDYLEKTPPPGEISGSIIAVFCSLYLIYIASATTLLVISDTVNWLNRKIQINEK